MRGRFLFLGGRPFMVRIQLPRITIFDEITEIRRRAFDVIVGLDVYEDHGPCWRLMLGALEIRWWLGSWLNRSTCERYGGKR